MLSTLSRATQANSFLLSDYETDAQSTTPLVNIHYEENNYQALVEHIKSGSDQGWILFLAPPGKPSTQFFQQAGIDKSRVLMIDSNKVNNKLELLSTLLKSDNYCTVVTWANELSNDMRTSIEADAKSTNTSCFIFCKQ